MRYAKYELVMKKAKVHDSKFEFRATSSEDVYRFASRIIRLQEKAEEYFCAVVCDTRLNVCGYYECSHGTIDSSMVHPREVFKPAIAMNAAAIVCIHNHPSGSTDPSIQDIQVTERLRDASNIIGIPILDHIIIGSGSYTSMKSEGYL